MTQNDGHTSVLLDNVCKLIHQKVHAENVSLVEKFAKTLYSNMSKEDLANRNDSDLYGAALSLWNSLESHMSDDIMVRVVNPELAKHGCRPDTQNVVGRKEFIRGMGQEYGVVYGRPNEVRIGTFYN